MEDPEAFFEEVDKRVWPLFLKLALRHTTTGGLSITQSDLRKLGSKVDVDIVWASEKQQKMGYSSFKRALAKIAARKRPGAFVEAFVELLQHIHLEPHLRRDVTAAKAACAHILSLFHSCLGEFFFHFATPPSSYERNVLKRHAPRIGVDIGRQSLTLRGWTAFCLAFGLRSRIPAPALAAIFVDSSHVCAVDDIGGLTIDEFLDAVLRVSLLLADDGLVPAFSDTADVVPRLLTGLRIMRMQLRKDGDAALLPSSSSTVVKIPPVLDRSVPSTLVSGDRMDYHRFLKALKSFSRILDDVGRRSN